MMVVMPLGERTKRHSVLLGALAVIWVGGSVGGVMALTGFAGKPGESAGSPSLWPGAGAALNRVPGRATLMMFAHPGCSCTQASVSELARVLAQVGDKVAASVVFLRPAEFGGESLLMERARAIPGVQVIRDDDGTLAEGFAVRTSGHVLVYGADGRLLFSGGITAARGHEGDSAGKLRLLAALREHSAGRQAEARVFGCELIDPIASVTDKEEKP